MPLNFEQNQSNRSDRDLLCEFVKHRRQEAFAQIVRRHGGMVMAVCRSVLRDPSDADDAAQAVFLTLAQRASSLTRRTVIVGWLHRVAWYVAMRATVAKTIRRRHEQAAARLGLTAMKEKQNIDADVLHAELERLPEKYRVPLLLHHFEGQTQEQTAALLGCTVSTMSVRLVRGRKLLRERLVRRGIAVSAVGIVAAMTSQASAAVTPTFVASASHVAVSALAGNAALAATSATTVTLSKGALNMLFWAKMKMVASFTAATLLVGGAGTATYVMAADTQPTTQHGQHGEQGDVQNGQSGEQGEVQNGQAGDQGHSQNGQAATQGAAKVGKAGGNGGAKNGANGGQNGNQGNNPKEAPTTGKAK